MLAVIARVVENESAMMTTVDRYTNIAMVTTVVFTAVGLVAMAYQMSQCYMDLSAFQEGSSERPGSCKRMETLAMFVSAGSIGTAFLLALATVGKTCLWRAARIVRSADFLV